MSRYFCVFVRAIFWVSENASRISGLEQRNFCTYRRCDAFAGRSAEGGSAETLTGRGFQLSFGVWASGTYRQVHIGGVTENKLLNSPGKPGEALIILCCT